MPQHFDMVLKGGRIFDGTGNPSYVADIGITESRIARIGYIEEDASEIADVRGFAVSPGFIDLHNHSDHTILPFPDAENYIMQGVTTSLGGNCGISMAPLSADFCKLTRDYLSPFLHPGYEYGWDWKNTGEFSRKIQENGTTQNVGFLIGHGTLRIAVKGFDRGACSPEEMRKMRALLDEAMEEGAFGLSAGLIYSPGSYASEEELSELTARIGKIGGFFALHMRNESDQLIESVEEAVRITEKSGAALHISHLKAGGRPNWGKVHGALAVMEEARARGMNVTCDAYPYNAGMTTITALLPPWTLEGGVNALLSRLGDPDSRETIIRDLREGAVGFENWLRNIGCSNVGIAACPSARRYEGMTLQEIAREKSPEFHEGFLNWLIEVECNATMVLFSLYEDDVDFVISHPLSCVVSDGWITSPKAGGKPHPRGYGTFPRFLARYVREKRLLSLEEAVRKITSLPASIMRLKDRGMIREGFRADLVVFDPAKIRDNATFEEPHQFPEGIHSVVVNGRKVVSGGCLTGARPGNVLRKGEYSLESS